MADADKFKTWLADVDEAIGRLQMLRARAVEMQVKTLEKEAAGPALRGALEDIAGELQTGVSATPGDTYTRRKVNVEKLIAKARKALAL
jgi:hypothetical protein